MKSFWLFRTNLRHLESYHKFKDLSSFKSNCWDFYLLQTIWFLENNIVDEVIVWRLNPKDKTPDIEFDINGKKFIQKFVDDFSVCLFYPKPYITFWRGGFIEYDRLSSVRPDFFSPRSFYLAAGKRTTPQYGGKYDKILVESDSDLSKVVWPFYKTANQEIFKPLSLQKKYDVCFVSNFTQLKFKGQDFFIEQISKSKFLRSLSICHIGNNPDIGTRLCKKFNISNIKFLGYLTRLQINEILNMSKFGLVTSSSVDGCPRVITEVMCSGIPLLTRKQTKLLDYYKKFGVVVFDDNEVEKKFEQAFKIYNLLKSETNINVFDLLTMEKVCKKNLDLWLNKN